MPLTFQQSSVSSASRTMETLWQHSGPPAQTNIWLPTPFPYFHPEILEERVEELSLFSLEQHNSSPQCPEGSHQSDGGRLSTVVHGRKKKHNGCELKHEHFRYNIRRNFLPMRTARKRYILPSNMVESSSLEVFEPWPHKTLSSLVWPQSWPPVSGRLQQQRPELSSVWVILWPCENLTGLVEKTTSLSLTFHLLCCQEGPPLLLRISIL